jgi:hypothetical protein
MADQKSPSKWTVTTRGEVFQKPITSVRKVEANGVSKWVINEMYWSNVSPTEDVAFVCLQHVTLEKGEGDKKETQTAVNVVSYAKGSAAMTTEAKIQAITANPDVAMALATLLR